MRRPGIRGARWPEKTRCFQLLSRSQRSKALDREGVPVAGRQECPQSPVMAQRLPCLRSMAQRAHTGQRSRPQYTPPAVNYRGRNGMPRFPKDAAIHKALN
jgi:hypothetical protein